METSQISNIHPIPTAVRSDMASLASFIEVRRRNQPPLTLPATWYANGDVGVLLNRMEGGRQVEYEVDYAEFVLHHLRLQDLPPVESVRIRGCGLQHIQSEVFSGPPGSPRTENASVMAYLGVSARSGWKREAPACGW